MMNWPLGCEKWVLARKQCSEKGHAGAVAQANLLPMLAPLAEEDQRMSEGIPRLSEGMSATKSCSDNVQRVHSHTASAHEIDELSVLALK